VKAYLGTKIVQAEPMTRQEFESAYRRLPNDTLAEDGYLVKYDDGYVSWSPREVFLRCYRPITNAERELVDTQ
jgi:hypothetical protein